MKRIYLLGLLLFALSAVSAHASGPFGFTWLGPITAGDTNHNSAPDPGETLTGDLHVSGYVGGGADAPVLNQYDYIYLHMTLSLAVSSVTDNVVGYSGNFRFVYRTESSEKTLASGLVNLTATRGNSTLSTFDATFFPLFGPADQGDQMWNIVPNGASQGNGFFRTSETDPVMVAAWVVQGVPIVPASVRAFRIAGGLDTAASTDMAQLDRDGDGQVTLSDVVALNRAGL
jgi:hypothetical protein